MIGSLLRQHINRRLPRRARGLGGLRQLIGRVSLR